MIWYLSFSAWLASLCMIISRSTHDTTNNNISFSSWLSHQVRSDQSLSCVRLFATPWIVARQAFLSITNSRSSLRLTCIESVMPSSHIILCHPLLLLPPIPPSIRVFSNESTLGMRWPKYWVSALASFLPKNTQDWSPLEWTGWISLQSKGLSRVFSNITVFRYSYIRYIYKSLCCTPKTNTTCCK